MPAEGGEPKRLTYTATLGRDDVSDRMGPNNIVMGWKNTTARDHLPLAHAQLQRFHRPALHGRPQRRAAAATAPAARRLPLVFARRQEAGLQPRLPRVPHLEALPRRHGRRHLDLRLQDRARPRTSRTTRPRTSSRCGRRTRSTSSPTATSQADEPLQSTTWRRRQTQQLTNFTDYDIKFPSLGDKAHRLRERRLHLPVRPRDGEGAARCRSASTRTSPAAAPAIVDVSEASSPSSIVARRQARRVRRPRRHLHRPRPRTAPTRNLTNTPGVHERNAKWSPDGKWIAYISDATGEDEICVAPQDGKRPAGAAHQQGATRTSTGRSGRPTARSCCGPTASSACTSSTSRPRRSREVDQAKLFEIREYAWSPDSKWIAYSRPEEEAHAARSACIRSTARSGSR